jgi:hypothetical protein
MPLLLFFALVVSQADEKEVAAERMAFMKQSTGVYAFRFSNSDKDKIELQAEPILRWNNPVSGISDGTVFIWTCDGRPEAAAQVFLAHRNTRWIHEFQSLSLLPLVAERDGAPIWTPQSPGLEMKPLSDAPPPAATAARRLQQLRALAREFSASVDFQGSTRYELRLLPNPLHRYGHERAKVIDGGLFAFVQGTNPEVLLLIEARPTDNGTQWHYALAPMTSYALEVLHKDKPVWSISRRDGARDPTKPFMLVYFQDLPQPK